MPGLLRPGLPKIPHPLAEYRRLGRRARLPAVFRGGGRLRGERQGDATLGQDLVGDLQEGKDPTDAQIGDGLIDDFLGLHRRESEVQRDRKQDPELVRSLTAQQRGQDGHEAHAVVQVVLVHHLVKGEVGEALDKLRVGVRKGRAVAGKHFFVIGFG